MPVIIDPIWETECMFCHRPIRVMCRRRPVTTWLCVCGPCCTLPLEHKLHWMHELHVHFCLAEAVRMGVLEVKEK